MSIIVLVEDDELSRRLLVRLLTKIVPMPQVIELSDGNNALLYFQSNSADMIIMDIQLPGMKGNILVQKLRIFEHLKDIPIIALSAHHIQNNEQAFSDFGFTEYLLKPIENDKLIETIEKYFL